MKLIHSYSHQCGNVSDSHSRIQKDLSSRNRHDKLPEFPEQRSRFYTHI